MPATLCSRNCKTDPIAGAARAEIGGILLVVLAGTCVRFASPSGLGAEGLKENVFCPNCGSKNDDSAARCAQCGFEIQALKPSTRFKGTMVMQAPVIPPTAGQPASPAPAARPSPLKGTMVGVAPPEMEDLRRQIAESRAAIGTRTSPTPAPAASPVPTSPVPTSPAAASPAAGNPQPVSPHAGNPRMKGTMIGLAPPGLGSAVSQAPAGPPRSPTPPPPDGDRISRPMPSQLKGTMVGGAPVDPAALAAALGRAAAPAAPAPLPAADVLGGTLLAGAPQPFGATQPMATQPMATQPMTQLGSTQPFESGVGAPAGWGTSTPGLAGQAAFGSGATHLAVEPQRSEFTSGSTIPAPPLGGARSLSTTPPAKSNLPVIVLIVLVVVLALALVGFGIALRNRGQEAPEPQPGGEVPAPAK
jgi:hypothetical protein